MRNRFSLMLFFYYSQFCILFSFTAVFFREQGYSEEIIGQLAALSGLAALAANPAAGRLADKFGEKKVSVICLAAAAMMTALLYLERKRIACVFIFFALVSVFSKAAAPLFDNWLYRYSRQEGQTDYGKTRAIGSLGGAFCAAGTGILIDFAGFGTVFAVCVSLIMLTAALALCTPARVSQTAEVQKTKLGIRMLLRNREYMVLIMTSAILFLGVTTEVTYYPLLFLERGGTNRLLGFSLFLMSCSEMTGMSFYVRLRQKISAKHLLFLALVFYTIKMALQLTAANTAGLIVLQLLQGVTYGLFLPSVVEMVHELVPAELSASGMGICSACFNGVGVVLGNWLASAICGRFGLRGAYQAACVCCLTAVLLYSAGMIAGKGKAK